MTLRALPSILRRQKSTPSGYMQPLPFSWAVLLILALLAPSVSMADDTAALDQLLAAIQHNVNQTRTVQCAFEQQRNLSLFAQPIVFTGKMELSRPDNLRWENLEPIPSVLIFAGDKGMRCNDDAEPVRFELAKDPMMRMVAEQIWTWVDGNYRQLQDRYDITLAGEAEIQLVPKNKEMADAVASVRVRFDQESLQPQTIEILETEGDSTVIRFSGYRINQPVDGKLFTTCYP